MSKVPTVLIAALAAVVLSLVGASTASAALQNQLVNDPTPVTGLPITGQPNETVTVDVFANDINPSFSWTIIASGSCRYNYFSGSVSYTVPGNAVNGQQYSCGIVVLDRMTYESGSETLTITASVPSPDTVSPIVTITSPTDGSTVSTSSVTLNYNATDNVGVVSCDQVNGSTIPLNVGANTITVNCTDAAGNVGSATANVTYTPPDTVSPVVVISSPVDGSTVSTASTTLNYNATDNVGVVSCDQVNGSTIPLNVGANTITVNCTDAAGNVGSATANVYYNAPPTAEFTPTISGQQVSFNASASIDPNVGDVLTYSWNFGDGTIASGVTTSHTYTNTIAQLYHVTLTVTDPLGLTGTVTHDVSIAAPPVSEDDGSCDVEIRNAVVSQADGNDNVNVHFPIKLKHPCDKPKKFHYNGHDGTADVTGDSSGDVTIPAGETEGSVDMVVKGNGTKTGDGTFFKVNMTPDATTTDVNLKGHAVGVVEKK